MLYNMINVVESGKSISVNIMFPLHVVISFIKLMYIQKQG